MKIGIIAEDVSDVMVVKVLTQKLIKPEAAQFKRFVGEGCGKVRRKCAAWAKILVQQGCSCIVVVHDLDKYSESKLRSELTCAVDASKVTERVVLIPKREIEAWLLYDTSAIAKAFSENSIIKLKGDPELIADPKRHLCDLIWKNYRKRYLTTVHNERIADAVNPSLLASSTSFAPHFQFVVQAKNLIRLEKRQNRKSR
jgi:hypothetical protein